MEKRTPDNTKIKMYTTSWCGPCKMAKKFLAEKGYNLEKTDLKEEDWFVVELEYQSRQERNSKGQLCFEFPIIIRTRNDKPLKECEV